METPPNQPAGNGKALATKGAKGSGEIAKKPERGSMFKAFNLPEKIIENRVETLATGGIAKWADLVTFQKDQTAKTVKPEEVTGAYIAGYLLGRHEIPDDNGTEKNDEGESVRFYYSIELSEPCAVTYKEGEDKIRETAPAGEIINLGERFHLLPLKPLAQNVQSGGARYAVGIKPHSKRAIGGGKTMWTFHIEKIEIVPPRMVSGEVTNSRANF